MKFPRIISVITMLFMGYLMYWSFDWVTSIPHEQLDIHHAGLIAAVFTPVAGIFKFTFDFVSDGKIDAGKQ